ncbi:hypothetical protein DICPUDRAFT_98141 [Dictyostelium purpureum]|uniref:Uncharacterized protein n=1 Tax=Dictyostelium purpureum TaxID=5786 RepID=F0ZN17_DICPU|nr:uncharacterized protein DICPUDRAFT_98141 [Dictyostelium purpureum]EGC34663.1 hypothetical protein DICPUDRAFT_98141 [Dictyostelium purpureum]|eukprot:XP_003288800.1 hypothetical protein DICPUDRAFT_98141 [Dictyostelium purpureum]
MIRNVLSSKLTLNKVSSAGFQIRNIASLKSEVKKGLFEELFPLATKIDPTSSSFIAIEPIEGTSVNGTLFVDKKTELNSLYGSNLKVPKKGAQDRVDLLVSSNEDKLEMFDSISRSALERSDDFREDMDFHHRQIYQLTPSDFEEMEIRKKKKELHKQECFDEYIKHLAKHHEKPNHLSFIITETLNITNEQIINTLQESIEHPISSYSIKRSKDRTYFGKKMSTMVSIILNSEYDDLTVDKDVYYKRFLNFGIIFNGERHHVIKSSGIKTIEIRISDDADEKIIREIYSKEFNENCNDPNYMKLSIAEASYNPFEMSPKKHIGYCNLTFPTHLQAIKAFEFSKTLTINGKQARPNLSRYIFADNSASSLLIKSLERRKAKQGQEIEHMRKMIDIKEKVKLLEKNLMEIRKRTQANNNNNSGEENDSSNNNNNILKKRLM